MQKGGVVFETWATGDQQSQGENRGQDSHSCLLFPLGALLSCAVVTIK